MFGEDSQSSSLAQHPNGFMFMQRNSLVSVEPNVSYARSGQSSLRQHGKPPSRTTMAPSVSESGESDEDARFLRLAHEALVATSTESNLIVDPTIQDLLARLQYVLSPHGNPIRRSESIHSNENGQLMIQNFYKSFPDLSNDIFNTDSNHDPSNTKDEGWNFLLDKSGSEDAQSEKETTSSRSGRKYQCSKCTRFFKRSSDLKRHEKQHLSIPANICENCGKGFARRDALKRHVGTLTCKRNAEKNLYHENLDILRSGVSDE